MFIRRSLKKYEPSSKKKRIKDDLPIPLPLREGKVIIDILSYPL